MGVNMIAKIGCGFQKWIYQKNHGTEYWADDIFGD
jgi:hypothetical protein